MAGRGKGEFAYRITIDPSPLKLARILGGLGKDFKNWKPAFQKIAPAIVAGIGANIRSRGAALGMRWKPVDSDSPYLRRKVREGFGRAELVATGALMREITTASRSSLNITARSLRYGTSLPYAPAVNFGRQGGSFKRGRQTGIKARWFMGWNDAMKASAIRELNTHAHELLSRAARQFGTPRP